MRKAKPTRSTVDELLDELLTALPEIKRDSDGSVWMQVPNAAINLTAFPRLTARALLAWAVKVETVVQKTKVAD